MIDDGAIAIAARVRSGAVTATAVAHAALDRIAARNPVLNAVTRTLTDRAIAEASAVDATVAAGRDPGPLAGVPYGVKDLFDVAGLPTTAGAAMRRHAAPAVRDAEAIRRLHAAGAVLVATLNMDEYAYGFATDNAEWGITRNPHGIDRLAGGSSGGSAAAVAGGMLAFSLGSDTNGSIRVPASLCGLYGLKPTHGALPMAGVFPFVDSFDDIGPFTTALPDMEQVHAVLSGSTATAATPRPALLGGWFLNDIVPELAAALAALELPTVTLPQVAAARSAAFLMTAAEGGARHLPALRTNALAFDPATRDRLLAGAALPAAAYLDALRFRETFRARCLALLAGHPVLIAPATGCPAPLIADPMVQVGGRPAPARAALGLYTQPISFVGLPALAVPLRRPGRLPIGLQLIAAPGREADLFAVARQLEASGATGVTPPA